MSPSYVGESAVSKAYLSGAQASSITLGQGGGGPPVTPPANTAAPSISGTPTSGQTLTLNDGTWTGSPTFTRQWKADGVAISGQTGSTLLLGDSLIGKLITVTVTGTNAGGSASATSAAVGPVAAAAPLETVYPTPSFGASDGLVWYDSRKTFRNYANQDIPSFDYDTIGVNTVSHITDLFGKGADAIRFDKSLQPLKGASGGPITNGAGFSLTIPKVNLINGLTKLSAWFAVKPRSDLYTGGSKRTLLAVSEAVQNAQGIVGAVGIASPGSGYAPGNYITLTGGTSSTASILRVTAVDGNGGVTAAEVIERGKYSVAPSNPVTQGSTTAGTAATATGAGATFNLTYTDAGSGSASERFAAYLTGSTTGRRPFTILSARDGAQKTLPTVATNAGQLANDVFGVCGYEIDFTTGSSSFFVNSTMPFTETWTPGEATPWAFGNADSVSITIGDNPSGNSPSYCEIGPIVLLANTTDATRRAAILAELGSFS